VVSNRHGTADVKQIYRSLGLFVGLIITALFILYVVRSLRGHDLSVYATPRAALGIVLAASIWPVAALPLALAWRAMLVGVGTKKQWRELYGVMGISQFAKYIPGHIAQYAGRVGMSLARGIPARALAVTLILETLLMIAAALAVGVGTGLFSNIGLGFVLHHGSQLAVIAALVALAIAGLFVLRRLAPPLLQRLAPKYTPALDGSLLPPTSGLVHAFVLYCVMYLMTGASSVLLASFLLPGAPQDYWLLIASLTLAWAVGFVTPGAPAGFGVREGLLLLMLTPAYTAASASIFIIALRLATTLGDVLILGSGLILLPKHGSKA
jgi:hypothetical protein